MPAVQRSVQTVASSSTRRLFHSLQQSSPRGLHVCASFPRSPGAGHGACDASPYTPLEAWLLLLVALSPNQIWPAELVALNTMDAVQTKRLLPQRDTDSS